jgi:hypothetical protein
VTARRLRVALERSTFLCLDLQTGQSFMISPSGEGSSLDWEPGQVARLPSGVQVQISFGAHPWRGKLIPNFTPMGKLDDG